MGQVKNDEYPDEHPLTSHPFLRPCDNGAIAGHTPGATGLPSIEAGHTVVWAAVGGKAILGCQGILEYSLDIPAPTDPIAAIPWESVGARKMEAANITVSFSCTRDTGGIDVGCSGTNVEIIKDVAQTTDRMAEATIVIGIKEGGPLPVTAPAPEAVARCHSSRMERESALIKEHDAEQFFNSRLNDAREDYNYRMQRGLPPHTDGYKAPHLGAHGYHGSELEKSHITKEQQAELEETRKFIEFSQGVEAANNFAELQANSVQLQQASMAVASHEQMEQQELMQAGAMAQQSIQNSMMIAGQLSSFGGAYPNAAAATAYGAASGMPQFGGYYPGAEAYGTNPYDGQGFASAAAAAGYPGAGYPGAAYTSAGYPGAAAAYTGAGYPGAAYGAGYPGAAYGYGSVSGTSGVGANLPWAGQAGYHGAALGSGMYGRYPSGTRGGFASERLMMRQMGGMEGNAEEGDLRVRQASVPSRPAGSPADLIKSIRGGN